MLPPLHAKQWDLAKAAHLLNRAGFGGSPDEIEALFRLGFEQAVERLVHAPDDAELFPKPAWAEPRDMTGFRQQMKELPKDEAEMKKREEQRMQRDHHVELIHWWLDRMHRTPHPLREKMTLFWHGHFATSIQKVKQPYLMWRQNETLRTHALGNFGELVQAMTRDPAMLVWLDTQQSRRQKPNENFARELMELFTLGIGNYSEQDIREAARAFTPYKIDRKDQSFRFARFQEDDGVKEFLGKRGAFGGDQIVKIILEQPVCARFIGTKLWEFFAYEDPSPAVADVIASSLRGGNYELRPLMRQIFRSAEFYSTRAIRTQIKSPVQWLVSNAKVLEGTIPPPLPAANALRQLGQTPFAPPNVKGWDGGKAWITTSTLLLRYNLANFALGSGPMEMRRGNNANRPGREVQNAAPVDLARIVPAAVRDDPKRLVAYLGFRLYQTRLDPVDAAPFEQFIASRHGKADDDTIRELLHLMMSTPQYQLT